MNKNFNDKKKKDSTSLDLKDTIFKIPDWLSKSPDLNSIENLWLNLKVNVQTGNVFMNWNNGLRSLNRHVPTCSAKRGCCQLLVRELTLIAMNFQSANNIDPVILVFSCFNLYAL